MSILLFSLMFLFNLSAFLIYYAYLLKLFKHIEKNNKKLLKKITIQKKGLDVKRDKSFSLITDTDSNNILSKLPNFMKIEIISFIPYLYKHDAIDDKISLACKKVIRIALPAFVIGIVVMLFVGR